MVRQQQQPNNAMIHQSISDLVEGHWNARQVGLIKSQVAPSATNEELSLFLTVAKSKGLDPFGRQIYCVHRYDKNRGRVMTIQTGIDGYRALADRTGAYCGNDDPVFMPCTSGEQWHPGTATVTVWKLIGGQRCGFTATARWSEYAAKGKKGYMPMWKRMPFLMLGKCAEALALRKAFPDQLSGIYTSEEMQQADGEPRHIEPINVQAGPPQKGNRAPQKSAAPAKPKRNSKPKPKAEPAPKLETEHITDGDVVVDAATGEIVPPAETSIQRPDVIEDANGVQHMTDQERQQRNAALLDELPGEPDENGDLF